MRVAVYMINGGDYKQGGQATANLKKLLKKISISPADLRRAVISAFEAEMNVVIHAKRGSMRVLLDTNELDVEVRDEGPGIPDIELAMKEGYSTAPPEARKLGYGAGMGLPNIKKNSDRFEISSEVGKGTCLSFGVNFKEQVVRGRWRNSLHIDSEKCKGCLDCIKICPTAALRYRNNKPIILSELCVDCMDCVTVCATHALTTVSTLQEVSFSSEKLLLIPFPFLTQFGLKYPPSLVLNTLKKELPCAEVYLFDTWEKALEKTVISYLNEKDVVTPLIVPSCPAILNLIALRFHSLVEQVAPFLTPIESAYIEFKGIPSIFVVPCHATLSSLLMKSFSKTTEIITPFALRRYVQPLLQNLETNPIEVNNETPNEQELPIHEKLVVSGMKNVITVLERVENGRLKDVRILKLYACKGGCFGSPFFTEEPHIARYRAKEKIKQRLGARAIERSSPILLNPGMRLDDDVSRALNKSARIEELLERLPNRDCAFCGAPSCASFAEDVIRGLASEELCPFRSKEKK